ncbi:zinc finger protein 827-like isoform X2 [Antennarius striatus]
MASDLLIRLSEATQKAPMHPGRLEEAEPQRLKVRGGQQHEPGLALSPDGPGASPEPPSLSHTPDGDSADTLASDMLRKLAELQEVSSHGVKIKEEEVLMEVDCLAASQPITAEMTPQALSFAIKTEDQDLCGNETDAQRLSGVKVDDPFYLRGSAPNQCRVKREDPPPGARVEAEHPPEARVEAEPPPGARVEAEPPPGAKVEEQYLRAVLWQDMSLNLASTLLHQLSERASRSTGRLLEGSAPPITSSPVPKLNVDKQRSSPLQISHEAPQEPRSVSRDQTSYFHRCHVCGFETDGPTLFHSHMTEHRQWERGSFSLRCCLCDHSTNQEAEMRAHAHTHLQGGVGADVRCPVTPPASSSSSPLSVALATQLESSTSEHRCRICQRSFPGQQELLVHFQGHRQGNQYRCDRCGHLTRTANKLVEHVRVHTGERPFTCDLCPYSAKRRDSLRLHCKVKHAGDVHTHRSYVHTHRSYVHTDSQRSHTHLQRLHTPPAMPTTPLHPSLSDQTGWRDLSPLLPISTLISLKPRCPSSSSSSPSSSSSTKHSFLSYLGLTTSL